MLLTLPYRRSLYQAFFLVLFFLASCYSHPEEDPVSHWMGYKPVYSDGDPSIAQEAPRDVEDPGKIYVYGKYLLVNEINKGIHVFDNEDPSQPIAISFLRIAGNTEMAVRENVLYANHLGNIVALSVDEEGELQILSSLELTTEAGVLPPKGFYFECIDPTKGMVVNWVAVERKNMDCYAIQ